MKRSGQKPKTKGHRDSRVTLHMAASLDGFIARKDGRVDWLERPSSDGGQGLQKRPGGALSRGAPIRKAARLRQRGHVAEWHGSV